jgi:hypothetical protein
LTRSPLGSFLALSIPLLLLLMGLFAFALDAGGLAADAGGVVAQRLMRSEPLPGAYVLGGWLLESVGLVALFLLVQGRGGAWMLDGLIAGWIAWIFRGPVMVVSLIGLTRLPRDPWWGLALRWLVLYTMSGILLAVLARRLGLER